MYKKKTSYKDINLNQSINARNEQLFKNAALIANDKPFYLVT